MSVPPPQAEVETQEFRTVEDTPQPSW